MELYAEFSALTRALEDAQVDYAVAGGLAVAIWGVPRATQDIDLLVPTVAVEAAVSVGRMRGFTIDAFPMKFRDGTEIRRITKPGGEVMLTLDLMLVTENLQDAWASRQRVTVDGDPIWVVSRDALIRMKAAAGRPRDLADVESLREVDR